MSDQQFREIQLSGKQLVFLFMTSVVVAVGVFLLGVSVGRGVRINTGGAVAGVEQSAAVMPPAELPPPTEVTPEDLRYHNDLQGSTTPPAEAPPDPLPGDAPADDDVPAMEEEAVEVPPATLPRPAPVAAAPIAKPVPPASDGWSLQVGAFRSRENADRQVKMLMSKGYAASVAPAAVGGLYRVRVGPFAQRAEADRIAARLRSEEGMASSVIR